jgi:hypothetical protein
MLKYSLNTEDYTWKNALLWGNFANHYKKAQTGCLGDRAVHILIAAAQFLPVISQIISIFEMVIHNLYLNKENLINPPPSDPLLNLSSEDTAKDDKSVFSASIVNNSTQEKSEIKEEDTTLVTVGEIVVHQNPTNSPKQPQGISAGVVGKPPLPSDSHPTISNPYDFITIKQIKDEFPIFLTTFEQSSVASLAQLSDENFKKVSKKFNSDYVCLIHHANLMHRINLLDFDSMSEETVKNLFLITSYDNREKSKKLFALLSIENFEKIASKLKAKHFRLISEKQIPHFDLRSFKKQRLQEILYLNSSYKHLRDSALFNLSGEQIFIILKKLNKDERKPVFDSMTQPQWDWLEKKYASYTKNKVPDENQSARGNKSDSPNNSELEELIKMDYIILGLKEGADLKTIKLQHRKLILKSHPDKVLQMEGEEDGAFSKRKEEGVENFKRISNAYQELTDYLYCSQNPIKKTYFS